MERDNRAALITGFATVLAALITVFGAHIYQNAGHEPRSRVALHVRVGDPSDVANHVKLKLEDAGYEVANVVMVNRDKAPSRTQVRYFQTSNSAGADKLIELLYSWGVVDTNKQFLSGYPGNNGYEIWFATGSRSR